MPLREGALHLAAHEERVRDRTQKAKTDFIVNHVADERSNNTCAGLRAKFVAMMPVLEWTSVLHVSGVMIPFELGDACDPLRAQRQEREDAKRRCDSGTHASCLVARTPRRRWWRGLPVERDQLGVARRGHDPRQVLRVGEEREDALNREGNPLLKFEMMEHIQLLSS